MTQFVASEVSPILKNDVRWFACISHAFHKNIYAQLIKFS